jgi:outer membrane protein OmpA-like peptidoglycan-associated protein
MKKILMSLVVAITMMFAAGGQANAGAILGTLTCLQTGPGITYIIFSKVPVSCTYEGIGPSPQVYSGVSGILLGLDLEYAQKTAMAYFVVGGAGTSPSLTGNYVGVKASATLLAGFAVQAGLAGIGNGFELVPLGLGVQQVGIGGTGGLAYLQLGAGSMPAMAQTFVVYFNFNKSDLTADGQKVVDNAAAYYKKTGALKVAIAGYTDTSGTAEYNMGLSHRRADTVQAALVKDGVPAAKISTAWYGKTHLAVPTPDGVKEPRNRRATIAIQ